MNYLIIVESFAKTKTIAKYLKIIDSKNNYIVTASAGHICDLPKEQLGFTMDTWQATYVITKENIIENIRKLVKSADIIYFATDPDTEGEAIANHIKNHINDLLKNKKYNRIKFNEITKQAIQKALENPIDIDNNMVNAQETRRILDRLIGFKLSPMLWDKFNNPNLSAGRVQSVALKICTDMLNEINNTKLSPYWNILGIFKCYTKKLECKLYNDGIILTITDVENIKNLFKKLSYDSFWDINLKEKISSQSPPPPYTTTTLQQDSYNKIRIGSKETMMIAQQLYEKGFITYMRTDSTNISQDVKYNIISYINENIGEKYSKLRTYKTKVVNAQEAHEAIRITNVKNIDIEYDGISDKHKKIYALIWKRTVASLMINAEYADIDIMISNKNIEPYTFISKKSLLINEGFLKILSPKSVIEDPEEWKNIINRKIESKKSVTPIEFIAEGNITEPPSMYNEVNLIKALEKEGIGRPSTYSSIIDKLYSKQYIIKGSNPHQQLHTESYIKTKKEINVIQKTIDIGGKQKDLLIPTDLGMDINKYLSKLIPFILDIKFTAYMEEALDLIALNKTTKIDTLTSFYDKIKPYLKEITPKFKSSHSQKSDFIKTKYGHCYYNDVTKKYTNIESYLKWKKITINELTEIDKKFIISLPKTIPETKFKIYLGQYGLYLKDDKNNNIKLDKNKWNDAINGNLLNLI
jgi:DNA topoisomerase-1